MTARWIRFDTLAKQAKLEANARCIVLAPKAKYRQGASHKKV
jgi:hypothetical protein